MITFKGYKNIITNDMQLNANSRIAFISMQLNDEVTPDLTEFKKIKEMSYANNNSDVLTIMYSKFNHLPERLFFDSKFLYSGDELADLREMCGATSEYKMEENASMKAYTLMASLTRRMMTNPLYNLDRNFSQVFESLLMKFSESQTKNTAAVYELLLHCVRAGEPLEKTASFFNGLVNTNMKKFFKF